MPRASVVAALTEEPLVVFACTSAVVADLIRENGIRAVHLGAYFFSFLRSAQYFRIRAPTAFRCAADIRLRLRREVTDACPSEAIVRPLRRSGNAA